MATEDRSELPSLIAGPILYSRANEPAVLIDDKGRLQKSHQRVEIIDIKRRVIPGIPNRPSLYELEITSGPNYAVLRLPHEAKLDKCDDVGGLLLDSENKSAKSFALGDGVGSTVGSRCIAIAAIRETLYRMRTLQHLDEDTMKSYAQAVDVALRERYDSDRFMQSIEELDVGDDPEANNWRRGDIRRLRENLQYTGATTLIAGSIQNDKLGVIRIGDGGFFVIGRDGAIRTLDGDFYRGATPAQICPMRVSPLDDSEIIYNESALKPGDLIFAYSDGLLKGSHASSAMLAERARMLLQQGVSEQEIGATLVKESSYAPPTQGWADDIVVICLRHE